jgi:hypothetical protein
MKKTFQLKEPGKDDQRVLDAIKHEVRKYVKRERRKTLTTGVDFWDFDCKVGASPAEPAVKHLAEGWPAPSRQWLRPKEPRPFMWKFWRSQATARRKQWWFRPKADPAQARQSRLFPQSCRAGCDPTLQF